MRTYYEDYLNNLDRCVAQSFAARQRVFESALSSSSLATPSFYEPPFDEPRSKQLSSSASAVSSTGSMTIGRLFRYAAIGACYGAAVVVGGAALTGAVVMPALSIIGAGAAFGAMALPGLRAVSKTAGRIVAYGPITAAAVTAGCVFAGGVGNALAWGAIGVGAVAMMAIAHRPEEILTGRRGAYRDSFRY